MLAVSVRNVIPGIEIMHEGMPELPENKAGIFVREGLEYQRLMPLLQDLIAMLAPQPLPALLPVEPLVKSCHAGRALRNRHGPRHCAGTAGLCF